MNLMIISHTIGWSYTRHCFIITYSCPLLGVVQWYFTCLNSEVEKIGTIITTYSIVCAIIFVKTWVVWLLSDMEMVAIAVKWSVRRICLIAVIIILWDIWDLTIRVLDAWPSHNLWNWVSNRKTGKINNWTRSVERRRPIQFSFLRTFDSIYNRFSASFTLVCNTLSQFLYTFI